MTADYKSHRHRPEKKPLPGFVWLLIGLFIGLFVALIIYLDKQPENKISFEQAIERDLAKLRQANADDEDTRQEPSPKAEPHKQPIFQYTYHTILKELEVLIPIEELRLGSDEKEAAVTTTPLAEGKQYLLQAGSFKQRKDADGLKAQLALLGLQANIESVTIRKERWYRVRLGPYRDSGTAFRELNRLKANGITAMAFTLKPGE